MKSFVALLILSSWAMAVEYQARFVELYSYKEDEGLPPRLTAQFQLRCNESFIRLIRLEFVDPESPLTTIYLGGVVEEITPMNCDSDEIRLVTIAAGTTFAGRAYQVKSITSKASLL